MENLVDQVNLKLEKGDYQSAIQLVNQILSRNTLVEGYDIAWFIYRRGCAEFSLEHFAEAITDFTAALDTKQLTQSVEALAFYLRGLSYSAVAKYDEAMDDTRNLLKCTEEDDDLFDEAFEVWEGLVQAAKLEKLSPSQVLSLRNLSSDFTRMLHADSPYAILAKQFLGNTIP